ncbi:hypothetical protein ACFRR6_24535 [Streptomyces sp. NPDC056891]
MATPELIAKQKRSVTEAQAASKASKDQVRRLTGQGTWYPGGAR